MMYTPAAKKRRLDTANEILRKPFKSPAVVVRDGGHNAEAKDGTASTPPTETKSTQRGGSGVGTPARRNENQPSSAKQFSTPTRRPFSLSRPRQGASPSPLRTTPLARKSITDAVHNTTTKPIGMKSARAVEGREEIIRQAERICGRAGAETDEELVALIEKWRGASRQAAQEVFEASRERVQSMGGMKAWRKTRREDQRSFLERMMEGEPARDHDEAADCENSPPDEIGAESDGDEDGEENEDDEEFTLGTMLKSMNIDFDIIGYDEDTGWWRDG
ncbi:uncharacterized protein CTRU02_209887 [Colletotrichum truncatum]|uniref:Uncharacterized protein n=1 Tax=Colletotrichum truncatum TaxID=5467 RepID=A0ACC3YTN0_COLTU|nr:uncharacterized protein CTRU02_02458 [Colletotrichum truncatum]KAF6798484.1 hypothetical protein CTRU02_02458 [Colletotrichum truncatum]